jgi:hypothetical protein
MSPKPPGLTVGFGRDPAVAGRERVELLETVSESHCFAHMSHSSERLPRLIYRR